MSRQSNATQKRARRKAYIKRSKAAAKLTVKTKAKAPKKAAAKSKKA